MNNRLNALVDASLLDVGALPDLARLAAENGATLIQYRDKHAATGLMVERARAILDAVAPTGIPVVINDRVDVALAADAQGVHLGRDDIDPHTARRLLGESAIIGLTVKNGIDAHWAAGAPCDYACIGGVFETLSKVNPDPPLGLGGFQQLRAQITALRPDLPVGAIAGIDLVRTAQVIAAGADGVAVISALFRTSDIPLATRRFRAAVDSGLVERQS